MLVDSNLTSYAVSFVAVLYSITFMVFTLIQLGLVGASHNDKEELGGLRLSSLVLLLVSALIGLIPVALRLATWWEAVPAIVLWLVHLALVARFYHKAPLRFNLLQRYRFYDIADMLLRKTPAGAAALIADETAVTSDNDATVSAAAAPIGDETTPAAATSDNGTVSNSAAAPVSDEATPAAATSDNGTVSNSAAAPVSDEATPAAATSDNGENAESTAPREVMPGNDRNVDLNEVTVAGLTLPTKSEKRRYGTNRDLTEEDVWQIVRAARKFEGSLSEFYHRLGFEGDEPRSFSESTLRYWVYKDPKFREK